MILTMVSMLILLVGVLVGVAFLTLLERKVLGYIQLRKGPNKVGFLGLLQPFSDAVKLFSKEQTFPLTSNFMFYYLSPVVGFILSLMLWVLFPFISYIANYSMGILYFLCVSGLGVYGLMVSGWSSNSNYSLLGGLRAVAQTISYEVSLALILISFLVFTLSLDLKSFKVYQFYGWFLFINTPMALMWVVSSLAETNRTPFDFAEGESELVSGFNVEYSSGGFALIFLAEYSSIIFMSMLSVLIFLGGDYSDYFFFLKVVLMSFFWLWVRGTLPRYRYDKLMGLVWKIYLPVSLSFILFCLGFKIVCSSLSI
uniref:NADH-ubiquinone oxidoreductase chain 1 n=1 Tax=Bostrichoidea sp. KM-2015 TaxID=1903809 RepID=A0A343A6Q8_9COLE|nr:NADH dehydrogenase subunit 1 [Bostrichoidea sp. KM-2015]